MKKIIIVSDSLRIGGIQQALRNFLNIIDHSKFNVELFLFHTDQRDVNGLNANIKLLKSSRVLEIASATGEEAKISGVFNYLLRKLIALLCYICGSDIVFKFLFKFERNLEGYDYAISFSNNINNKSVYFGQNKFVLEKVKAKKKFTWLHVDYDKMNLNNCVNTKEYYGFDKIICVSEAVRNSFINNHPELECKCRVVYNYIDCGNINKLAKEHSVDFKPCFNIVSVGRLDENKSPISYVNIAEKLKEHKIDFNWWIIGNGPQYAKVEKQIIKNDLKGFVKMLGELSNPYPYIANADLFVSASKSESFGIAIVESLCLSTPVISRYFPALSEYLTNNYNGIIVNGDDTELANQVIEIIQNRTNYTQIKNNTGFKMKKEDIISKFESILKEEG